MQFGVADIIVVALLSGAFSFLMLLANRMYDRRIRQDEQQAVEPANLSKSEQQFRHDILEDWKRCREAVERLEESLQRKTEESAERDHKLREIAWNTKLLCAEMLRIDPDMDRSICDRIELLAKDERKMER